MTCRIARLSEYRQHSEPLADPVALDGDPGWRVSDLIVSGLAVLFAGFILVSCTALVGHWFIEAMVRQAEIQAVVGLQ